MLQRPDVRDRQPDGVAEQLPGGLHHRRDRVPVGDRLAAPAGSCSVGTNVLAMNVSGKITMKLALLTTSGRADQQPDQGHHPAHRVGEQQQQQEAAERLERPTCGSASRRAAR